jgi:hypothetical protein
LPLDLASWKNTLSSQLLLNSLGYFDETWYKKRSHCVDMHIKKGNLSKNFLMELWPLDLTFCLKNTLSLQLLLNPFGRFWWNLGQNKITMFSDAYYKGNVVPNCLEELWLRVKKVCGHIMCHLVVPYFSWNLDLMLFSV